MRILVDENIPLMTVAKLKALGHDVLDIRGSPKEGMSDSSLWELAQAEQRLLVTTDKGFAARRAEPHCGILIVRLGQPNRTRIHRRVLEAIDHFDEGEWRNLVVAMRDKVMSIWPPR